MKQTLTPSVPLTGTLDVEGLANRIPVSFLAKGMFFDRFASVLGPDFARIQPTLSAPPKLGRYLPFSDYPQSDYLRVAAAAAAKKYPHVGLREAIRQLSRDDFKVFAGSTLGKVALSMVGDAKTALLRASTLYKAVATGDWTITTKELSPTVVRIEFNPNHGAWEFQLGQLESVVLSYGGHPTITVTELPGHIFIFEIDIGSAR